MSPTSVATFTLLGRLQIKIQIESPQNSPASVECSSKSTKYASETVATAVASQPNLAKALRDCSHVNLVRFIDQ